MVPKGIRGEAVTVVGVSQMKGKLNGADVIGTRLFTKVSVRRSNRWQAQTIQQTVVPRGGWAPWA
jgi:hypothetical protein